MNKLLVIAILSLLVLIPSSVEAATTADVVITARGIVVGSPSGLSISYIDDDYVDINWAKGIGANNTMIRVGTSAYPATLTDGDLVYYGTGTNCQYTIDYETVLEEEEYNGLYFVAWSQGTGGAWQLIGATTGDYVFWKDVNLMLLTVVLIALVLTFFAFRLKNVGLSIISAFVWVGIGIYQLNIYYSFQSVSGLEPFIGYVSVLMSVCMFIAPIMFSQKVKVAESPYVSSFGDRDIDEIMQTRQMIHNMRKNKRRRY